MKAFVKDLQTGAPILRDFFLLKDKQAAITREGKQYLRGELSDRTGTIGFVAFDIPETDVNVDDFCKVEAVFELYKGKFPQLKLSKLRAIRDGDAIDDADFWPCSEFDRPGMYDEVLSAARAIRGDLRALVVAILGDDELHRLLLNAPAGVSIHHAYRGGLLEHILSLIAGARAMYAWRPELDLDLLIAAAICHDIGKVYELEAERGLRYSARGRLLGHISIGMGIVDRFAESCARNAGFVLPYPQVDHLSHLIASHHGSFDFGSPVLPATREAIAFHCLDLCDSKCAAIAAAEKLAGADAEQTDYIRALGGTAVIARREVAAAEEENKLAADIDGRE